MRVPDRIIAGLLAVALTLFPPLAWGQSTALGFPPGTFQNKAALDAAPATGCSQATTFLGRTSGLSGTETTAYTNLICGLVTDGIITGTMAGSGTGAAACGTVLDALYIFATNTTTTAHLNLCSTSFTATELSSPTFTADQGYSGIVANASIDTTYTPSTAAGNLTLNSASLGVYDLTNRARASVCAVGADTGTKSIIICQYYTGANTAFFDVNDYVFSAATTTQSQGFWVASRNGSSTTVVPYFNGSALSSLSETSVALPTSSIRFLKVTSQVTSSDIISGGFIGAGLSAAQVTALSNRINGYMTALGINVY